MFTSDLRLKMSCELKSDNFGNKMKCIQKINDINDEEWTTKAMTDIVKTIFDGNEFKNFLCKYLLNGTNINNEKLNKLYCMVNDLSIIKNDDNDTIQNICELNNDVLTKVISLLDIESIINFEVTCKHACYVARQPVCLSNSLIIINTKHKGDIYQRCVHRFSKIEEISIFDEDTNTPPGPCLINFLNTIAPNIKYLENNANIYTCLNMDNFKSLEYYHDYREPQDMMDDTCLFDSERFMTRIYQIKHLNVQGFCNGFVSFDLIKKPTLKSAVFEDYVQPDYILEALQYIESLESLSIDREVFQDMVESSNKVMLNDIKELAVHYRIHSISDLDLDSDTDIMINKLKEVVQCPKLEKLCIHWRDNSLWRYGIDMNIYGKLKTLGILMIYDNNTHFEDFIKLMDTIIQYKRDNKLLQKIAVFLSIDINTKNIDAGCFDCKALCDLKDSNMDLLELMLIINNIIPENEMKSFKRNLANKDLDYSVFYDNEWKNEQKFTVLEHLDIPHSSFININLFGVH